VVVSGPSQICFQGHIITKQVFEACPCEEWRSKDTTGLGSNLGSFIAPSCAHFPNVFDASFLVHGKASEAKVQTLAIHAYPLLRVLESVVDSLAQLLGAFLVLHCLHVRQVEVVIFIVKIESSLCSGIILVYPVEECPFVCKGEKTLAAHVHRSAGFDMD